MRVGVVGAGRIGGFVARQCARAGHEVMVSFSRSPQTLEALAREAGCRTGSPADAAAFAEVIVLSVPWDVVDDALAQAGPLVGQAVVDTTNPFGDEGLVELPGGASAAAYNAARIPGAGHAKAFNTLTAGFQATVPDRPIDQRPAMFYAADDPAAGEVTAELVSACGFVPVELPWQQVSLLEAPRQPGRVYGEEYSPEDARRIAGAARRDPDEAARLAAALKQPG